MRREADPTGQSYCFERGATEATGGEGWADVWKRGHFGWEYKGKRKNLEAAFGQLQQYALALENPPLLIVCDLDKFVIRTNWTNTVSERYEFDLEGLREPQNLEKLKWAMSDPERLRPGKTRQDLTEDAAGEFATLAQNLRSRGHSPEKVPRDAAAARTLARRTLTDLYNEAPDWLAEAHRALDEAVAAAYGWAATITAEDALRNLLDLNLSRSSSADAA
jgi:type II restriction/modification system DNA methylase subunit YeeA